MDNVELLPSPVKSPNDEKEYRLISLKNNGLQALLVCQSELVIKKEDKEPMAAFGMCVEVGSFHNFTVKVDGMAHFCEHMMFLGSQKYPEQRDIVEKYLSQYGGSSSAYTQNEYTVFNGNCFESGLEGALDVFSSIFTNPLLSKDAMMRERNVLDSEFKRIKENIEVHIEELIISNVREDHPANVFAWGNLKSLKEDITDDDLHERLKKFVTKYYVANRMHLVIQSKLSLNELQTLVVKYFKDVPHDFENVSDLKAFPEYSYENVFKPEFFEKIHCLNTEDENQRIIISWVMPPMLDKYKTKPLEYVKSILESRDVGSLRDYLTEQELAKGFNIEMDYAGFERNSLFTLFKIQIKLREEGLTHPAKVLDAVFSYLLFLKEQEINENYYKYLQKSANDEFLYYSEESLRDNVERLSIWMTYFEPEDVLTGSDLYLDFNKDDIKTVIEYLNSSKFNILIVSDKCEIQLTNKWYGFGYEEEDLLGFVKDTWNNRAVKQEFALPETENTFLYPSDFFDFPFQQEPSNDVPVRKIPVGKITVKLMNKDPSETGVISYYQIGKKSTKSRCLLDLFHAIIKEPLYFRLRTREQLAYGLGGIVEENKNILGYRVAVNSSEDKHEPEFVFEKINDFMTVEVKEILSGITDEKFKKFCAIIIQELKADDDYQKNFLETVTIEHLLEFYEENLSPKTSRNVVFYVVKPTDDIFENLINVDSSILDATSYAALKENFETFT